MFELVAIERGYRKSVWVIIGLAERSVLYHDIANCGEYCIFYNICRIRVYRAEGGYYCHLLCFFKLDNSMQSLLDDIRVNRRGSAGGSITWADVVAICRDQLSVVALVPSSTTGRGSSNLIENSTLGV